MTVESQEEVDGILKVGKVVAQVRDMMLEAIEPGITTAELDKLGESLLTQLGAKSAPRTCYNFPGATCISVNEEVAHGIPGSRVIRAGDVVNVDVSAELDGYFADTGSTTVAAASKGQKSNKIKLQLCQATQEALMNAIAEASADAPINRIGEAVQRTAKKYGFKIIKNLAGHGLGRSLHEAPEGIVSYYDRFDTRKIGLGQVLAIEPFLSTRSSHVRQAADGWTLLGHPDNLSAQFEHTIIITKGQPIIATLACG